MTRDEMIARALQHVLDTLDDHDMFNGIDDDIREKEVEPALRKAITEALAPIAIERIGPYG